ncbi:MAG: hypothetical protein U0R50_00810 [Gaiellales bacterium]
MSEILDEVARGLATSMPRRRALSIVGMALVGLCTAGRAGGARKPLRKQEHWCHKEVRANGWKYCQQESQACFPTCCPREWACSKGKCGSNGCCEWACCDPCKPHAAGGPDGAGGCKPGPVPDRCAPKTCGPDITAALEAALGRVKSEFAGWSDAKRLVACTGLTTIPAAAFTWDIRELGPGGRADFTRRHQGCTTCGFAVQVGRDCHYSGSVNYIAYGAMMRLCHDHYASEGSSFKEWFSSNEMLELIYIHKNQSGTQAANFQASNEWALAGYNPGQVRPYPPGDRPECEKRCTTPYNGRGLTVNWLPYVIGPDR